MKDLSIDEFLLKQVINAAGSAIIITDVRGTIKYVNPRFCEITGYRANEVLGKTPRLLNSGRMPPKFYRDLWHTISGGRRWRGRVLNKRKDGSGYWSQQSIAPIRDEGGKVTLYLSLSEDVTENESLKQQYRQLAFFDELTGLGNRRMFRRDLDMRIDFANRADDIHMLLLANVDDFKSVNERIGHQGANQLLKKISQTLRANVDSPGDVYRLGSDEFAFLAGPFRQLEQAHEVAERLCQSLRSIEQPEPGATAATLSLGAALFPGDAFDSAELLRQAEIALRQSRSKRKTSLTFYRDQLAATNEVEFQLLQDLIAAIEDKQIYLVGQPIIALQSGCREVLELLLRWRHPKLGFVSPQQIIRLAETFACLHKLSLLIVDRLIEAVLSLETHDNNIIFSLNLNVAQALDEGLIDYLCESLDECGIARRRILLELVETDHFNFADAQVRRRIQYLKQCGFLLALDDFGAGYATFEFLNEVDPDYIKIDRGITTDIENTDKKRITLEAILALTSKLGVVTVVEGVENAQQDRLLQNVGHRDLKVQGYFYAKPQSLDQLNSSQPQVLQTLA